MKFGIVPLVQAEGTILAHSTRLPERVFKKGHLLTKDDINLMTMAGISEVVAARLEVSDIQEDVAAERVSTAIAGTHVKVGSAFTGRCNLKANIHGLITYDKSRLDKLNLVDESITVATLAPYDVVTPEQLIATIKIIPLAVTEGVLSQVESIAFSKGPIISISPLETKRIGIIMSRLPGMKESIFSNTLNTATARVEAYGSEITQEIQCLHDQQEVKEAIKKLIGLCDVMLIFGASAIIDRQDVLPAALVSAGGRVDHFGMPVDPGNLLFLGKLGDLPVVGMPGCARSPKLNGFDWVLWRLLANIDVSPRDIMLMGGGGLLKEISERGQLRQSSEGTSTKAQAQDPKITALVLAAGSSVRMGKENKLLADVNGKPMIRHVIEAITGSNAHSIIVVTGHEPNKLKNALKDGQISFVHNPDYELGLSASLKVGLEEVPPDSDGVLICLGDMPLLTSAIINTLIRAFDPIEGRSICIPVHGRKRGNPVLWDKSYFLEMAGISGDTGAKHVLEKHADQIVEVVLDDDNILFDVDTPERLKSLNERLEKV